ncbi:MAG: hypothetical protein GVY02_05450 [Bacteroidetes bacterium]|jgi:asparagine synthase (glutamine-hydrolysing)|nr:hypothetical protein [Bacteroidota bacterium]
MSAIFGFCSFENLPESLVKQNIQKMKAALTRWAPDGFHTSISGSAGFGVALQSLRNLDKDVPQPVFIKNRSLLFTAAARLDNRNELMHVSKSKKRFKNDSSLILEQYLKNGRDVSNLITGDWAFAAFDKKRNRVELVRDHIGNTAVFYTVNRSFLAFAPTPHALLALDGVSGELNEWKLACEICRFPDPETADQTKWKDIFQLLPSHKLILENGPASLSVRRYWSFDEIEPIRYKSEEEYYEEFRHLMKEAVRSRISGYEQVGTTLSSGYDSGTVTAFAAKLLSEENRSLTAYTSVPRYKKMKQLRESIVNEWPIAQSHQRLFPNMEHIPVEGSQSSPHHVLKKIVTENGETVYSPTNAFWIDAILNRAKSDGIQALLTGQLGNAGISWNGSKNQILYQLLEGQWGRSIKALKQFKVNYGLHWYKVLKFFFLWPLLSPIKHSLKQLVHPDQIQFLNSSAINQNFAARLNIKTAILRSPFRGYKNTMAHPHIKRVQIMEINTPIACATWHRKGAYHNLDALDPTADMRLLRFCFGIPDELHSTGDMQRMLIKNSMKNLLPDEVLNNRYRGRQAADIGLRLLDYKNELRADIELISKIPAVQEYLDIPLLYDSLDRLSPNLSYSMTNHHSNRLLSGLMFGYFLEKFG